MRLSSTCFVSPPASIPWCWAKHKYWGQVKEAYSLARALHSTGLVLNQLFEKAGLAPRILTPPELHNSNLNFPHICNQYVIRAEKRDELQQYLRESDCASEVYYPIPFHLQECFSNLECDTSALKNSEEAAKTVLALPIYPELPREMQEYMVERIASFFLTH